MGQKSFWTFAHGEAGIARDHLCYMIKEPPLAISAKSAEKLARVAEALRTPLSWCP